MKYMDTNFDDSPLRLNSSKKTTPSSLDDLSNMQKKYDAIIRMLRKKKDEIDEMVEEYTKFNLDGITSAIADIISVYEGKEYSVVKGSYITTVSRTVVINGQWAKDYIPQYKSDILLIINKENIDDEATYHDYIVKEMTQQDYIIIHKSKALDISENITNSTKTYDGDDKIIQISDENDYIYGNNKFTINKHLFKEFNYIIAFIDCLINYRIKNEIKDLSKENIEILKNEFIRDNILDTKLDKQSLRIS